MVFANLLDMPSDNNPIKVRKNTGELVDFDVNKLRNALQRSGAGKDEIGSIIQQLKESIYDGISTHKIYQIAYAILKKKSTGAAGRYRLKKAMLELGPTGYPFEQFIAKLLHFQGYEVKVGQIVEGRCVKHEVDVVARKDGKQIMVECKYHSDKSAKSDVKVPLYIHSRFLDVRGTWEKLPENSGMHFDGMLVTNSRFTDDAREYGSCAGLIMVSWDYPVGNSLRDWIDQSGYHPLTALQSLKKEEKQAFLNENIVLCSDLRDEQELLDRYIRSGRRIRQIINEIDSLTS